MNQKIYIIKLINLTLTKREGSFTLELRWKWVRELTISWDSSKYAWGDRAAKLEFRYLSWRKT